MRISDWSSDVCSSDLDYWHRLLPRAKYRRGRSRKQGGSMVNIIKQRRPLSERPAEAGARDVAGHWEADFMLFAQYGQCILVAHERRSEENTSELQSLMRISYAVLCLKKNTHTVAPTTI